MGVNALQIAIATGRQAHYRLPANSFQRRGHAVTLYTATPRQKLRGFDAGIRSRLIPSPVAWFSGLTHGVTPVFLDELDSVVFDQCCVWAMQECDLLLGAASSSAITGAQVKRRGGKYVLDRACPDIRVQQRMMAEEAAKVGGRFRPASPWFLERQVREYELADVILVPSHYSAQSFPDALQPKVVIAPIQGRIDIRATGIAPVQKISTGDFVVGVLGGHPLRKGYLYILQAWKELALPKAKLMIKSGMDFNEYPALKKLLEQLPNVSIVEYLPDIRDFYRRCDAFVLPSVDDGFGMALLEALANGVPSIATRNCGASELLESERDFLLVDACSVDQLKVALLRLYESAELRERLAVNGPATVAKLQQSDAASSYEDGMNAMFRALGIS
jgi:glycosyltransferase involved in cell wall biosynthesis